MRKNYKNLGLLLTNLVLTLVFASVSLNASAETAAKKPTSKTPATKIPTDLQPLEDIPPPPMVDDGALTDEPQVTIVKKKGETIEEYRINGQLYMIKVTPAHGVPYYMHKEDQDGGWLMDGPNQPLSIPKWTLFRF
ncbi:MAG: DUF2782 domain-containing protein [Methylotenera sp.]